jgi:hypothetical protein
LGFELNLAAATGGGILYAQTILRTFGAGQTWMEIKSITALPVAPADQPRTIGEILPQPLIAVSEQGEPIDFCTAEIELFWHPDRGDGALKLRAPPRPVVPQETALAALPPLPPPFVWDGMTGLAAIAVEAPQVVAGCPVLQLVAVAPEGVHSLSVQSSGQVAGGTYRVTVWIGETLNTNLRLTARDTVNPKTGRPTREADVKINLHSLAMIESHGDVLNCGAERQADGWRRIWLDFTSSDGNIAVALFCLEAGSNFHVFNPKAQRLLFGGVEIDAIAAATL